MKASLIWSNSGKRLSKKFSGLPLNDSMNKTKSLLIIDDEKGYRDFYKFILTPLGFTVSTAEDGAIGLQMAVENDYDIILLDVHLPKLRGPEVLAGIKNVKPEQIVIIFSSSSDPSFNFETRAKELGAFDCLYKPVDLDDILKTINRAQALRGDNK